MRVRLHNIGPIRDADIDLAPLTVLVGPNGSGKTTLTSVTYACCLAHAQATEQAFELVDNPFASRQQRLRGERLTMAIGERWQEVFVERLDFELRRCCSPDLSALGRARRRGKEAGPRIEVASDRWCLPFRLEGDSLCIEKDSKSYRPIQLRIPPDADPKEVRNTIADSLRADIPRRAVYFPRGTGCIYADPHRDGRPDSKRTERWIFSGRDTRRNSWRVSRLHAIRSSGITQTPHENYSSRRRPT